ncbi:Xylose isomerase-like TIM barrel [Microbulbifer aggregans]|uniref:Xylose isomerase-like TIM barrel n=1 Tax=Microbulbifer aggregans TaxID=1769779 RepID=A0A1C9W4M3_9GAMM|nr:sugar phosphate isomerase/epimerase family protein [Microbulbifer aggregans]AOS96084.1 Xylose isomerase-like TIM barrel [Microbulbifer aggregans]
MHDQSRRQFLSMLTAASAGALLPVAQSFAVEQEPWFRISLAQWSLHRAFQNRTANPQDFPRLARRLFDIDGVEYVNQFYSDNYSAALTRKLQQQADGEGVQSLLIMVDGEGDIGAETDAARKQTVARHQRWAEMAKELDCHSIRVNAHSHGSYDEQMKKAADGLHLLGEYCEGLGLNVLVENHGGLSSNGEWLSGVMRLADHPRVGTLPDFGNFHIDRENGLTYDRYRGVRELMPWAKAISAKSYDFDENGEAVQTDFQRMLDIVRTAGYRGWVGIEYEGNRLSEIEGIEKTLALLQRMQRGGQNRFL